MTNKDKEYSINRTGMFGYLRFPIPAQWRQWTRVSRTKEQHGDENLFKNLEIKGQCRECMRRKMCTYF